MAPAKADKGRRGLSPGGRVRPGDQEDREYLNEPWERRAALRRSALVVLMLAPTAAATMTMASVLPQRCSTAIEVLIIAAFAMLFAWISIGFWTAVAGSYVLLKRYDRFLVSAKSERANAPAKPDVKTAVLFPVCNEDMDRVAAGIEATYRSVERAGCIGSFDFYILSDTQDPDRWADEELAWHGLRQRLGARGRLFFRRRLANIKKKSGNIADFCRRHGRRYTYMIVMDADSVMAGETMIRMVRIMERRRNVGILQTVPAVVGGETLLARSQQFASRLYGPVFAAGLHFWQLGDAQYWGHNAIIRVQPFMRHCALPRLPGKPPLGGDIISHDFVEAALMRRAGWGVWLAYDIPGSYEECPPNLQAELGRDRRWCKGNLQHLRLLFAQGMFPAHRAVFLNGIASYGSAVLWFLFIALSSAEAVIQALVEPAYFHAEKTLFPIWPVWQPLWALSLLASTGVLLFLPKVLSLGVVCVKGRAGGFGGVARLAAGIVLEVALSAMLAPIRMLFHSRFVITTLLGRETGWHAQQRDDKPTSWGEALRFHIAGTLMGLAWGVALFALNRSFFYWVIPIMAPLALAVPLSVAAGSPRAGRLLRRMGLLLTPEEVSPPRELAEVAEIRSFLAAGQGPEERHPESGFARAVLDPTAHALRKAFARGPRRFSGPERDRRAALAEKALVQGPGALSAREKRTLLMDGESLDRLREGANGREAAALGAEWAAAKALVERGEDCAGLTAGDEPQGVRTAGPPEPVGSVCLETV